MGVPISCVCHNDNHPEANISSDCGQTIDITYTRLVISEWLSLLQAYLWWGVINSTDGGVG